MWLSVAGSLVLALLEMLGIALILPLIRLLTDPDGAAGDPAVEAARSVLGGVEDGELIAALSATVFSAFLVKGLLSVWILYKNFGFLLRREALVATQLLNAYMRAPFTFHLQRNTAHLLHRIEVATNVLFSQVVSSMLAVVAEAAVIVGVLAVLVLLQPLSAAVAVAYFLVLGIAYQRLMHRRAAAAGAALHVGAQAVYKTVADSLAASKEISVRHRQGHFVQRLFDGKQAVVGSKQALAVFAQLPRYYLETALIVGVALMSVVLVSAEGQKSAVAGLGLFLAAGFRLLPSLQRLLVSLGTIRSGTAVLDAVHEDFVRFGIDPAQQPGAADDASDERALFRRELRFEDVEFVYPGSVMPVLKGVSFSVLRGTAVALVGPSGAGKTTVTDIVLGLLQPGAGSVLVDGTPLDELGPAWQRLVGYVPQEIHILDDTLRANIALGWDAGDVDHARLERAVRLAQLEPVVAELPLGMDTVLGERGARLSGGQRQRIGIARALYVDPQVLVLDEATSALDSQTEQLITETIEGLRGTLTVIVVAHRLSTVRNCDAVVYMRNGQVLDEGTFDELALRLPDFADAVRIADGAGRRQAPTA
jgi:ABC-type multidrug transport system fused ATPase/permease subunit